MRASREMVLALEICIGGVVYFLERRQVCMIFTLKRCRDGMHTIYGCDPREMYVEMVGKNLAIISIFSVKLCLLQPKQVNVGLKTIFGSSNIHLDQVLSN